MTLRTEHLARCIQTLPSSLVHLCGAPSGSIEYEVFRNAVVKGFELSLETADKFLRRALKTFVANPRTVDELTFKDVIRHAARHGLMDTAAVQRWFDYRDNRNSTAHDYGEGFAEETLALLPGFVADAQLIEKALREKFTNGTA